MSETTTTTSASSTSRPAGGSQANRVGQYDPPGRFCLSGRIDYCKQVGKNDEGQPLYETLIFTASPDPYEHPPRFCISSTRFLGRKGDMVDVEVQVICYQKKEKFDAAHPDRPLRIFYNHYLRVV